MLLREEPEAAVFSRITASEFRFLRISHIPQTNLRYLRKDKTRKSVADNPQQEVFRFGNPIITSGLFARHRINALHLIEYFRRFFFPPGVLMRLFYFIFFKPNPGHFPVDLPRDGWPLSVSGDVPPQVNVIQFRSPHECQ